MATEISSIQDQYESFPYPPIPWFGLPRKGQGKSLSYEFGLKFTQTSGLHRGIRILVAGSGTFEPLVVAQNHPEAEEIVALDFSGKSLEVLRKRHQFAKFSRFYTRLPKIRFFEFDLMKLDQEKLKILGKFDYILASNLLQHVSSAETLLANLNLLLNPQGLLRLVTYPQASRIWMRRGSLWLRENGISPGTRNLVRRARKEFNKLSEGDPVRANFNIHPENKTPTGIVDAFLNAWEKPWRPLELQKLLNRSGFKCIGEAQEETSCSSFLDEICPELQALGRFEKLQILDDLLELCSNPILWFVKLETVSAKNLGSTYSIWKEHSKNSRVPLFRELQECKLRIQEVLGDHQTATRARTGGVNFETLLKAFKEKVGPRVDPKDHSKALPGLALSDYAPELEEEVVPPPALDPEPEPDPEPESGFFL